MTTTKDKAQPTYFPAKLRANLTPGQMLKTIRKLQEMSQEDLAQASGVEQATISAMEHERVSIGTERAKKLARALRVHPAVIVFPDWTDEAETVSLKDTEASEVRERTPRASAKKPGHGRRVA